jgi:hypothetical protein
VVTSSGLSKKRVKEVRWFGQFYFSRYVLRDLIVCDYCEKGRLSQWIDDDKCLVSHKKECGLSEIQIVFYRYHFFCVRDTTINVV